MGFRLANINGRAALLEGGSYYDLESVSRGEFNSDPMAALNIGSRLSELTSGLDAKTPDGSIADAMLMAPVPNPPQCYGIGLNYRNHAAESGAEIPVVPLVFTKFPSCITSPDSDLQMRSDFVDYEGELVVVIGKAGKDIGLKQGWDHVFGLCVGQDYSDRAVQMASQPPQFSMGKSFDSFGPIGPYITSPDALDVAKGLQLTTSVNGDVRQDDSTGDLIFDVPTMISYLSHITPLQVGDIIFTGTPGGVGAAGGKFLKDGDVVVTAIEGLGELTNRCVRAIDHPHTEEMAELLVKFTQSRKK